MIGIGFDRNQDSPGARRHDVNPFLELPAMQAGRMRRGYLLGGEAVTLGLSDAVAAGFGLIRLPPGSTAAEGWATPPGCFRIAQGPVRCGRILVDTGLDRMLIGLPPPQRPAGITAPDGRSLRPGVPIAIGLPRLDGAGAGSLDYRFTTGDSPDPEPPAPASVTWVGAPRGAFLNTGRRLLRRLDYLYDATAGLIGFRARPTGQALPGIAVRPGIAAP